MKNMAFIVLGVTLVFAVAWPNDGLCQCSWDIPFGKPFVIIQNMKNGPLLGNGTFFIVDVASGNPLGAMNGLVEISAQNAENTDEGIYEFDLTPTLRNAVSAEWLSSRYFTGQGGTYEVTIERFGETFSCLTDPIAPNLTPLPVPEKLKVSFEKGPTKPTLSFNPIGWVPNEEGEWYRISIFDKDFTRRIYRVDICTKDASCIKKDGLPTVTFPDYRSGPQTNEALVPGEEYLFRAESYKALPGPGDLTTPKNLLLGVNYKLFKVPE